MESTSEPLLSAEIDAPDGWELVDPVPDGVVADALLIRSEDGTSAYRPTLALARHRPADLVAMADETVAGAGGNPALVTRVAETDNVNQVVRISDADEPLVMVESLVEWRARDAEPLAVISVRLCCTPGQVDELTPVLTGVLASLQPVGPAD